MTWVRDRVRVREGRHLTRGTCRGGVPRVQGRVPGAARSGGGAGGGEGGRRKGDSAFAGSYPAPAGLATSEGSCVSHSAEGTALEDVRFAAAAAAAAAAWGAPNPSLRDGAAL